MAAIHHNVIVADDEPAMRRLLRTVLSSQGYGITEAVDGSAALQAVLAQEIADLLVLDLGLPDVDGLQIIKHFRTAGANLPIIILSHRSDDTSKVMALDLGADDYVRSRSARASFWLGYELLFATGCMLLAQGRSSSAQN